MTHRRLGMIASGATMLAALAGCGSTPPTSAPAPTPGTGLPPRPATLRITGVDPCTLLTPSQYSQLKVGAGRRNDNQAGDQLEGQGCIWSTTKPHQRISYGASLVTNRGAEYALGAEPLRTVDGYAATTTGSALADPQWYCLMLVDVGPGQSLLASYSVDTEDVPGMSHVKACDNAQTAAGSMLANLRAAQTGG